MDLTILLPTLQDAAAIRFSIGLWSQYEIVEFIKNLDFPECFDETSTHRSNSVDDFLNWYNIENKVTKRLTRIRMPELLRQKIFDFIKPIGTEIASWRNFHKEYFRDEFVRESLHKLCWTALGTINKKKTAELIIEDDDFDLKERYKLSCFYCLESHMIKLWDRLPGHCKVEFYNHDYPDRVQQDKLVVMWTYDIEEERHKFTELTEHELGRECDYYKFAFDYSTKIADVEAIKYFYPFLKPADRKSCLMRNTRIISDEWCFPGNSYSSCQRRYYPEILCFFLSIMTEEERIEVYKSCGYGVLLCLLRWPWQNLFLKLTEQVWPYLSLENYGLLLSDIVCLCMCETRYCYYQKLFYALWQRSPTSYRKYILDHCTTIRKISLVDLMFQIGDIHNVRFILNNVSDTDRKDLLVCSQGMSICKYLVCARRWDLLKFFIEGCTTSKSEIVQFRKKFEKAEKRMVFLISPSSRAGDIWAMFLELVRICTQKYTKKPDEGKDAPPLKKPCNMRI